MAEPMHGIHEIGSLSPETHLDDAHNCVADRALSGSTDFDEQLRVGPLWNQDPATAFRWGRPNNELSVG